MGWKIGDQNVGQVTTEFEGGLSSTSAYLGLRDSYAIYKTGTAGSPEEDVYSAEIVIGVWASKTAKENGEQPVRVKGLNGSVFVSLTQTELSSPLGSESILSLLASKLIPALELIKPEWAGKLVADF